MYQATPKQHLKLNSYKKLSNTEAELKKIKLRLLKKRGIFPEKVSCKGSI